MASVVERGTMVYTVLTLLYHNARMDWGSWDMMKHREGMLRSLWGTAQPFYIRNWVDKYQHPEIRK